MSIARTVTVVGSDLFRVALTELGDATQWNRIASLNRIYDPRLVGVNVLKIPPRDPSAGGGVLVP